MQSFAIGCSNNMFHMFEKLVPNVLDGLVFNHNLIQGVHKSFWW